jgi:hypothetical protein
LVVLSAAQAVLETYFAIAVLAIAFDDLDAFLGD